MEIVGDMDVNLSFDESITQMNTTITHLSVQLENISKKHDNDIRDFEKAIQDLKAENKKLADKISSYQLHQPQPTRY